VTVRLVLLALLCTLTLGACQKPDVSTSTGHSAPTSAARDPHSGLGWVTRSALPSEATGVLDRIGQGGPFTYAQDGSTFGNRERLLPSQARGYYREYTVRTPGERDRGARRIVCGGQPATRLDECYYTADHYASFRRIQGAGDRP